MTEKPISIDVKTRYMEEQSHPEASQYAFAYQITISNQSDTETQLLSRHWIIIDGNEQTKEVRGEGVVGEQPVIAPGTSYTYTSGVVLETPVGTMEGSYQMKDSEGNLFDARIAPFLLAQPGTIN